jgi:glucose-1-phosphate thymidylyltransferase
MPDGKIVILAAGISSRMKKSTAPAMVVDESLIHDADRKSKSMIGVGKNHRPFLDYLLYNCRQAGYTDVLIVVGEKDDSIRNYYGEKDRDNEFFGLKISYATQKIPSGSEKPLGTADALYQGLNYKDDWKGSQFTICNSDNLYSQKALALMLQHDYRNAMIDYDRSTLQFDSGRIERFAVTLKDDEGFIMNIIEKPTEVQIKAAIGKDGIIGVSMNIFQLQYDMIFPFLEKVPLHPVRHEKELPQAITMMIEGHPKSMFAFPLSEHVPDLTDKNDIVPVMKYLETHFENIAF